jgi:predicted tellurium resistance membrane protein TerC
MLDTYFFTLKIKQITDYEFLGFNIILIKKKWRKLDVKNTKLEDTKWTIRSHKSTNRQHNDQKKTKNDKQWINKILHRKLNIEQHKLH